MRKLKVGTRKSPLAMRQTQLVIAALEQVAPNIEVEIVGISTKGDRLQTASLTAIGGKGVFVKEVEQRLLRQQIDFAVHSLKDMPAILPPGLILAATPPRADARDCLVLKEAWQEGRPLVIGSSSIRRIKQLQRPNFRFEPIRGAIETRLAKMQATMDGTVLACAGLERMGYLAELPFAYPLAVEDCIPAVGQGILAVECRSEDHELQELLKQIDHEETRIQATAERQFLAAMNGNCDIPLGGHLRRQGQEWQFAAYLAASSDAVGRQLLLNGTEPELLVKQAVAALL